jgi:putative phosphoribosyl transferase
MNLTDLVKIMPLTIPGRFKNRFEAGRALAKKLIQEGVVADARAGGDLSAAKKPGAAAKKSLKNPKKPLIVAIPRGGVAVGAALAKLLDLPLAALFVKKLTPPGSHELAIGAIAEDGGLLVDEKLAKDFGADVAYTEGQRTAFMQAAVERRTQVKSAIGPIAVDKPVIKGREILLVDDGMTTGYTVSVAAQSLRRQGARRITLAVPVTSEAGAALVLPEVDKIVAVRTEPFLYAVGSHYDNFAAVSDQEVLELLTSTPAHA